MIFEIKMSAFSRECCHRLHVFARPRSMKGFYPKTAPSFQAFNTSSLLRYPSQKPASVKKVKRILAKYAAKPIAKPSPQSTAIAESTTASPPQPRLSSYQSYAITLAQKSHSTLLYTAPSHTSFKIASYTTGTFCLAWAYYSINTVFLEINENIAWFVPWTFGVVSLGMVWFGTTMLLNSSKLIYSMTAIPRGSNKLEIEIVLRKMFPVPGFPARKIYVAPEYMTIPAPLARTSRTRRPTQEDLQYLRMEEQEEKVRQKALFEKDRKDNLLTMPFRQVGRFCVAAGQAVVRSFNKQGFMEMRVQGKILKLDCTGGWALDDGKAIDRLAKLEPHVGGWFG